MSRIVVINNITLDGVMQAPGRADEDTRDGFEHGGWAVPYNDQVSGQFMGSHMVGTRAILLGRRTYSDFAGFWPKQSDNPFTNVLTVTPKYVASTTLDPKQEWANTIVLGGDAVPAISDLRSEEGGDIVIMGSGDLVRSLARSNLIDEYLLLIHPLALGSGRRLFAEEARLSLTGSLTTTMGVVIATYRPLAEGEAY
jgi:dihydrofolate reductase